MNYQEEWIFYSSFLLSKNKYNSHKQVVYRNGV
nr:MAG TPA: hypothetical protein [Caudoviricetes sp.]